MNRLRRNTFLSCANNGADDENRQGGRSTLMSATKNHRRTRYVIKYDVRVRSVSGDNRAIM